eukprot:2869081-Amphidinium_carterae.1
MGLTDKEYVLRKTPGSRLADADLRVKLLRAAVRDARLAVEVHGSFRTSQDMYNLVAQQHPNCTVVYLCGSDTSRPVAETVVVERDRQATKADCRRHRPQPYFDAVQKRGYCLQKPTWVSLPPS